MYTEIRILREFLKVFRRTQCTYVFETDYHVYPSEKIMNYISILSRSFLLKRYFNKHCVDVMNVTADIIIAANNGTHLGFRIMELVQVSIVVVP